MLVVININQYINIKPSDTVSPERVRTICALNIVQPLLLITHFYGHCCHWCGITTATFVCVFLGEFHRFSVYGVTRACRSSPSYKKAYSLISMFQELSLRILYLFAMVEILSSSRIALRTKLVKRKEEEEKKFIV